MSVLPALTVGRRPWFRSGAPWRQCRGRGPARSSVPGDLRIRANRKSLASRGTAGSWPAGSLRAADRSRRTAISRKPRWPA